MDARAPQETCSHLARWMGVMDANTSGFVHGGTVLRLIDEVAGLAAMRHCRHRVVTGGLDRTVFLHPVRVGDLLTLSATVNAAWRTSMEAGVRVETEDPLTGERRHTNTAYLTMVAVDEEGRPVPVPPLEPQSPVERRRAREAQMRRENRLAERAQIVAERERATPPATGR
jgi:acyl-CoA hydrolase